MFKTLLIDLLNIFILFELFSIAWFKKAILFSIKSYLQSKVYLTKTENISS